MGEEGRRMSSNAREEDEDVPRGDGKVGKMREWSEVVDGEVVITVQCAFYLKPPCWR